MFYILSTNTLEESAILPIDLTESLRTKHAKICRKFVIVNDEVIKSEFYLKQIRFFRLPFAAYGTLVYSK